MKLNVVDYLRVDMDRLFAVGNDLFNIFNKLPTGINVVVPDGWRPEEWNNPYLDESDPDNCHTDEIFEEGADAMLKAVKAQKKVNNIDVWGTR